MILVPFSGIVAESSFTKGFSFYMGGAYSFDEYTSGPQFDDAFLRVGLGRFVFPTSPTGYSQLENALLTEGANTSRWSRDERQFRAGLHKDIQGLPYLRINAGIVYGNGVEQCKLNCGEFTRLAYLEFLQASPNAALEAMIQGYAIPLPAPSLEGLSNYNNEYGYEYYMVEGGMSLHPFRDQLIDPYLGLDLGLGVCYIDIEFDGSCRIVKMAPKVGIQANVSERFFAYFQMEYELHRLRIAKTYTDSNGNSETYGLESPTFSMKTLSFGVGFNL
tara:strand:+ start:11610 stop:12434 length:825 start_codon:yes stop_codon:yes gene_type:complete